MQPRAQAHDDGDGAASLDSLTLLVRAQTGDDSARDALLARYYERVLRIVRSRTGPLLARLTEPEDLVQDAFLEAVRLFERFEARHDAGLIHWFAAIVENQLRNSARHHKAAKRDRRREVELDASRSNAPALDLADSATGPLERLDRAERERLLDACIAELPEEEREAILLRDYAGGTWDWITEQLGRPTPQATRELHRRARLRLMTIAHRRMPL